MQQALDQYLDSPPKIARLAGFAYLVTIATGLFAEVYARGSIWVANDPVRTTENFHRLASLYRWAILSDCMMLVAYVLVTALLYRLFKPTSASVSLMAALMSILGLALLTAGTASLTYPLETDGAQYAIRVLRLHASIYKLTGIFFGAYCLLIGALAVRSNLLPRLVGLLMITAGAVFVADAALWLVAPQMEKRVPDAVLLVSLIGEGSLAISLTLTRIPSAAKGTT